MYLPMKEPMFLKIMKCINKFGNLKNTNYLILAVTKN